MNSFKARLHWMKVNVQTKYLLQVVYGKSKLLKHRAAKRSRKMFDFAQCQWAFRLIYTERKRTWMRIFLWSLWQPSLNIKFGSVMNHSRSDVAFVFSQCNWALNAHLHWARVNYFPSSLLLLDPNNWIGFSMNPSGSNVTFAFAKCKWVHTAHLHRTKANFFLWFLSLLNVDIKSGFLLAH